MTGVMVAAVKLCHQGHALFHLHNQHQAQLAVHALGGSSNSSSSGSGPSLEALAGLPLELASSIQSFAAVARSEAGAASWGVNMHPGGSALAASAPGAGCSGAMGAPAAAASSNGVGAGVASSSLLVPGGLSNAAGLALTHAAAAAAFIGAQAAPFMAVAPVAWAAAAEAAAGSLLLQPQGHINLTAALAGAAAPAAEGAGAAHHRAAGDGTAALPAAELAGLLAALHERHLERQQQQGRNGAACLPANASSWSQAVSRAFGQWDLSADLLSPQYRDTQQPTVKGIQAPAECDPLEVVRSWRQRKQQQQQQLQQ
jgi:hypothetical protein